MREADFGAVDETIADGFDKHKRFVVFGIEDDLFELGLLRVSCPVAILRLLGWETGLQCLEVVHGR